MDPYVIHEAKGKIVPVVVSVPHCGTHFPPELADQFNQQLIKQPDDTDWFVDTLYSFVPAMGITMICAVNSRWIIDLNRDKNSQPLYSDGRIITALCPTSTFLGEPLYLDKRSEVAPEDVLLRIQRYYQPYHQKIQTLLDERKKQFGTVLLWDCHSIRQKVPTIQRDSFPDLILGDNEGKSASPDLIETALQYLSGGRYSVSHNHPFKGGTITRSFGIPNEDQHALQLEMCKVHYMDDSETRYHPERAAAMQKLLSATFRGLIQTLEKK